MEKQPLLVESPDETRKRENERCGQFSGVMQRLQGANARGAHVGNFAKPVRRNFCL
jgi:hypothetical protein